MIDKYFNDRNFYFQKYSKREGKKYGVKETINQYLMRLRFLKIQDGDKIENENRSTQIMISIRD